MSSTLMCLLERLQLRSLYANIRKPLAQRIAGGRSTTVPRFQDPQDIWLGLARADQLPAVLPNTRDFSSLMR